MVGTALKPYYRQNVVSKEQYTEINRTISRMLYGKVGNIESLNLESRLDLERVAKQEVQKTLDALSSHNKGKQRQREPLVGSDSDGDDVDTCNVR